MKQELFGDILSVRAVEDTVRATHKYTEGIFSRYNKKEEKRIQGGDFPSRIVTHYYEVYPDLDLEDEMTMWDALLTTSDFLWGAIPMVEIIFVYNYVRNRAVVTVRGGNGVMEMLENGIPGWKEKLEEVKEPEEVHGNTG